jgi:membrane fusion protein, multidrug efflux system
MYKPNTIYLIVLLALFLSCSKKKEEIKGGRDQQRAMTVETLIVSEKPLDHTYSYTGTLLANEEVDLRSEISGRVVKINFNEGRSVAKGQLLVKIFDDDLQANLKKNQLQLELAIIDETRKKELLRINGISKEEYDNSLLKLKSLEAETELIKAQIAKTEIRAPFSGIVGLRMVSEGSFVSPTTLIASMQQLDPIKIDFSVPEKYMQYMTVNKEIEFTIEGSDNLYKARIYAIEAKIDQSTRTIKIRASCRNTSGKLYPGSFANIKVNLMPGATGIVVPAKSLIPVLGGQQVFVIRDGKVNAVQVKTGVRTANEIEIIEGLQTNDSLIMSGLLQIKQGMPVKGVVKKQ